MTWRLLVSYAAGMNLFPVRRRELVLALGLAVISEVELFVLHLDYERSLFVPLMLLVPLTLLWRTRYPLAVMVLNLGAWVVIDLFTPANEDPLTLAIALGVAVYSVGAHTGGLRALVGAALIASMITAGHDDRLGRRKPRSTSSATCSSSRPSSAALGWRGGRCGGGAGGSAT